MLRVNEAPGSPPAWRSWRRPAGGLNDQAQTSRVRAGRERLAGRRRVPPYPLPRPMPRIDLRDLLMRLYNRLLDVPALDQHPVHHAADHEGGEHLARGGI